MWTRDRYVTFGVPSADAVAITAGTTPSKHSRRSRSETGVGHVGPRVPAARPRRARASGRRPRRRARRTRRSPAARAARAARDRCRRSASTSLKNASQNSLDASPVGVGRRARPRSHRPLSCTDRSVGTSAAGDARRGPWREVLERDGVVGVEQRRTRSSVRRRATSSPSRGSANGCPSARDRADDQRAARLQERDGLAVDTGRRSSRFLEVANS